MTAALAISSLRCLRSRSLLGHAPEGMAEIREVGERIAQFLEQRRVELVPFQRLERVGVEPDRVVEPAQPVAHPADDVDQQRRRRARDLGKRRASDSEHADRRARPHRGRALKMRQRAKLANQTGRIEGGDRNSAARAVGDHRHLSGEDQHGVVRLLPLTHEGRFRLVGPAVRRLRSDRRRRLR